MSLEIYADSKKLLGFLLKDILVDLETPYMLKEKDFREKVILWQKRSTETNWFKYLFIKKESLQSFVNDLGIDEFVFLLIVKGEKSGLLDIEFDSNSDLKPSL